MPEGAQRVVVRDLSWPWPYHPRGPWLRLLSPPPNACLPVGLVELVLPGCGLEVLPNVLPPTLRVLDVGLNRLMRMPPLPDPLEVLRACYNIFSSYEDIAPRLPPHLRELSLSENHYLTDLSWPELPGGLEVRCSE